MSRSDQSLPGGDRPRPDQLPHGNEVSPLGQALHSDGISRRKQSSQSDRVARSTDRCTTNGASPTSRCTVTV